ncbi:hypothetical protein MTO96_022022 [Rhipicephalus appendiculatus]
MGPHEGDGRKRQHLNIDVTDFQYTLTGKAFIYGLAAMVGQWLNWTLALLRHCTIRSAFYSGQHVMRLQLTVTATQSNELSTAAALRVPCLRKADTKASIDVLMAFLFSDVGDKMYSSSAEK